LDIRCIGASKAAKLQRLNRGRYWMPSSAATLREGERRLNEIRYRLQNEGRL
jgi:hypothetical protein